MISFPTVSLFRWCNLFHFRRVAMMRNLLAPYEQRPWAQTNWILVRLWRVRDAEKRKNTETERGESTFTLSLFFCIRMCVCMCVVRVVVLDTDTLDFLTCWKPNLKTWTCQACRVCLSALCPTSYFLYGLWLWVLTYLLLYCDWSRAVSLIAAAETHGGAAEHGQRNGCFVS